MGHGLPNVCRPFLDYGNGHGNKSETHTRISISCRWFLLLPFTHSTLRCYVRTKGTCACFCQLQPTFTKISGEAVRVMQSSSPLRNPPTGKLPFPASVCSQTPCSEARLKCSGVPLHNHCAFTGLSACFWSFACRKYWQMQRLHDMRVPPGVT